MVGRSKVEGGMGVRRSKVEGGAVELGGLGFRAARLSSKVGVALLQFFQSFFFFAKF